MIVRSIIKDLLLWKNGKKTKPLILRGARQVGKTTVINELGKTYKQYISLNLELKQDAQLFTNFTTIDNLIQQLFFEKNKQLAEPDTLIFIDEIQAVPEALNLLRYFYEQYPQYNIIAAGSMLETILNEKVKIPVGRVTYKILRPLSFEEFLQGCNETEILKEYNTIPQNNFSIKKTTELFNKYTQIGGMPEVVQNYINTKDVTQLQNIYDDIWIAYEADVEKYARNTSMVQVIRHVIAALPMEVNNRIKFQHFGNSNYKSREVGEALRTLEKALLLHLIYPNTSTELPISTDNKKAPRLQLLDTGLLNYKTNALALFYNTTDISNIFKGKIIEHIVGQEILATQFTISHKLNFWIREKKDAAAEVDYIINYNNYLIPVEVKSGATGTLRSLQLYMQATNHHWAIRLYNGEIKVDELKTADNKIFYLLNLPYHLAAKLSQYIQWFAAQKPIA
jgi:uncharacterized protein